MDKSLQSLILWSIGHHRANQKLSIIASEKMVTATFQRLLSGYLAKPNTHHTLYDPMIFPFIHVHCMFTEAKFVIAKT